MGTVWFCLVALMLTVYVVLDGFDLGAASCTSSSRTARRNAGSCLARLGQYGTQTKCG